MFGWIKSIFSDSAAKVTSSIMGGLDSLFTSDEERLAAKAIVQEQMNNFILNVMNIVLKEMEVQASVIKTEMQGSWMQKNWRPILMFIFMAVITNNYILAPYLMALFDWSVELEIPPEMWGLLKLGIGGYVVGRSVESGIKHWKGDK